MAQLPAPPGRRRRDIDGSEMRLQQQSQPLLGADRKDRQRRQTAAAVVGGGSQLAMQAYGARLRYGNIYIHTFCIKLSLFIQPYQAT